MSVLCDICHKQFVNARGLRIHQQKMHKSSQTQAVCPSCNKVFRDDFNLRKHNQSCIVRCQPEKSTASTPQSVTINNNTINNNNTIINIVLTKQEELQNVLTKLQPLSTETLAVRLQKVIEHLVARQLLPYTLQDWARSIFYQGNFSDALICTDFSRGTIRYTFDNEAQKDSEGRNLWKYMRETFQKHPHITDEYRKHALAYLETNHNHCDELCRSHTGLAEVFTSLSCAKYFSKLAPQVSLTPPKPLAIPQEETNPIAKSTSKIAYDDIVIHPAIFELSMRDQCEIMHREFMFYSIKQFFHLVILALKTISYKWSVTNTNNHQMIEIWSDQHDDHVLVKAKMLLFIIHERLYDALHPPEKFLVSFMQKHSLQAITNEQQKQNMDAIFNWIKNIGEIEQHDKLFLDTFISEASNPQPMIQ